jgi:hypothetical protein
MALNIYTKPNLLIENFGKAEVPVDPNSFDLVSGSENPWISKAAINFKTDLTSKPTFCGKG